MNTNLVMTEDGEIGSILFSQINNFENLKDNDIGFTTIFIFSKMIQMKFSWINFNSLILSVKFHNL